MEAAAGDRAGHEEESGRVGASLRDKHQEEAAAKQRDGGGHLAHKCNRTTPRDQLVRQPAGEYRARHGYEPGNYVKDPATRARITLLEVGGQPGEQDVVGVVLADMRHDQRPESWLVEYVSPGHRVGVAARLIF